MALLPDALTKRPYNRFVRYTTICAILYHGRFSGQAEQPPTPERPPPGGDERMTSAGKYEAPPISGRTTILTIVGHPVSQVRSPTTVNAEFARTGIDAALVAAGVRSDVEGLAKFAGVHRHVAAQDGRGRAGRRADRPGAASRRRQHRSSNIIRTSGRRHDRWPGLSRSVEAQWLRSERKARRGVWRGSRRTGLASCPGRRRGWQDFVPRTRSGASRIG